MVLFRHERTYCPTSHCRRRFLRRTSFCTRANSPYGAAVRGIRAGGRAGHAGRSCLGGGHKRLAQRLHGHGGYGRRLGVGRAAHRRHPCHRNGPHVLSASQPRLQPEARLQVHVPAGGGRWRVGRGELVRRAVHRALRHDRHGKHRGRCHCDRHGRTRRPLLDGGGRLLRHGHEIRRGSARGEVPRSGGRWTRSRRPLLLHRERTRPPLEAARRGVRVLRHARGHHGHRHHNADPRHHLGRAALLRPGIQSGGHGHR